MTRSVALSPQFGNTVVFGPGFTGRRRAKSVHVPLPEGLRVVAVCVPEEIDDAAQARSGRPTPHRTPVARRRTRSAPTRAQSVRRAQSDGRSAFAGPPADVSPAERELRRAGPARSSTRASSSGGEGRVQPVARTTAPRSVAVSARRPQQAKLRLTRRGQIVVTLLVTFLLLAVFSLGRFSAGASGTPVAHRTVVVQTGDTLWSIASKAAPSADPRVTVEKIRLLNHLEGGGVQVGQQLQLP